MPRLLSGVFYLVVRLLGATSLPASAARRIRISERSHISEALHDVSWWVQLCTDYRLLGVVPRGIRISEIVNPPFLGPDDCPLVLHVDAAENDVGGFWNGTHGNPGTRWCRAPLPRGITLAWERGGNGFIRDGRRSVSSGFCEAAALLGAFQTFLPIFAAENPHRLLQHGVLVFSDSSVVVDVWNKKHPFCHSSPLPKSFYTHWGLI